MTHLNRDVLALRVISVSGHQAIARAGSPTEIAVLKHRMQELFADLEAKLGRGSGHDLRRAIEAERKRLREAPTKAVITSAAERSASRYHGRSGPPRSASSPR